MSHLNSAVVHVYPDHDSLSAALAEELARSLSQTVRRSGRCSLALSGGTTPRTLYSRLAERTAEASWWAGVEVFFCDERWVPHEAAESNFRMVRETFLDRVPLPSHNVHPVPTDAASPDEAAAAYERQLRAGGAGHPRLDLVLLGMGADGHTASLFPGSPALAETEKLVAAILAPTPPHQRITFTLVPINAAAAVHFLVTGAHKAKVVARALDPTTAPAEVPAAGVRPAEGRLEWWLDQAAASCLDGAP